MLSANHSNAEGSDLGFDLLGGTRTEEAKKLVEVLNEQVLDIFVTTKEEAAEAGAAP